MDILLDIIKKYEGCRLKAYRCPAGVWTIGYGHTGRNITENTKPITQAQADTYLEDDAAYAIQAAIAYSPILSKYPTKRQAIADFIVNLGIGNYIKSTLKKRVDSGDWANAVIEIKRWNKSKGKVLLGLVKRRAEEAELLED